MLRRFLAPGAAALILITGAAPAAAAGPPGSTGPSRDGPIGHPAASVESTYEGAATQSGQLAQSDESLLQRNDSAPVNVMIKFDLDPLASYHGGITGLRPTSPQATGRTLRQNSGAVSAYSRFLIGEARAIRGSISRAVPGARLGTDFLTVYGGVAARLPANRARELLSVPGVAAVQYDHINQPTANDSPIFVGATQVWPDLGGSTTAGEGVKIGVIDTGIWPEHPMLADPGIDHPGGGPYGCQFPAADDPDLGDAFACNDKLIGAYAFVDTYLSFNDAAETEFCNDANTECSPRDPEGHGTHTATTAAGSHVASTPLNGVDRGPISGIAPGASLIAYRVCLAEGCYSSDSVAAIEQAIVDDVDVINYSISGGLSAYADPVELAFLDAYAAGISVNASAGNDGSEAGTANHAGPWVNTVAASTLNRSFRSTLNLVASNGDRLNIGGVTVTAGITSAKRVVLASSVSGYDVRCLNPAPPGAFTGRIVACRRGLNGRVEKGYNVLQGGAAGMILFNDSATVTDLDADNHWLPAIHVQHQNNAVPKFIKNHSLVNATWSPGAPSAAAGDVMASFSSRGPSGDFIKPDVTAPGVQILAGMTPEPADVFYGPPGQLYQAIAGTSMSSPHAAGVAALLRAGHPDWTPGEIKSAMMTSALQQVFRPNGSTSANPFERGAGSIRVNRAIDPVVVFDVAAQDFYESANDELGRINLNLASINAPSMDGIISATRSARNVSGATQTITITTRAPTNTTITVSPRTLTLAPGEQKSFTVTIDATRVANGQYFGQVTLDPAASGEINAVLPVAFTKKPGDLMVNHTCAGASVRKNRTVRCTVRMENFATASANVELIVRGPAATNLKLQNWSLGSAQGNGFAWNGTLTAALPPAVTDLDAPGDGFVDISGDVDPESSFGIDYGDETLVNYNFGSLGLFTRFGDRDYGTVGVASNGYLVMGGGDVGDITAIPQDMPDPSAPNNVLAPYWTDLDPSAGGDLYIGETACFLIFQWHRIPIAGTITTRTFQVWIIKSDCADQQNAGDDYITFEYDPGDNGQGAPGVPLNVGAEDAAGLTAAQLGIDGTPGNSGYRVETGAGGAGGLRTITYDIVGKKVGTYRVAATVTSGVSAGTVKKVVSIRVRP